MTVVNGDSNGRFESTGLDMTALFDTSKLQAVLGALVKDLSGLDAKRVAQEVQVSERIELLDKRIQEVTSQGNTSDLEDEHRRLREHEDQLLHQEARLAAMEHEFQDRLASVERKVGRMSEVEREIEERFAAFESKQHRVDAMEREHEDLFAELEKKVHCFVAVERHAEDRFANVEDKVHRAGEITEAWHSEVKEELMALRLSQTWRAEEVAQEASQAEERAAEARRLAAEAEEAATAERQRRQQEREALLEKDRLADELAAAERQRRRLEHEQELEKERLADEAASAERQRQRQKREAELDNERRADEIAMAERQRQREEHEADLQAAEISRMDDIQNQEAGGANLAPAEWKVVEKEAKKKHEERPIDMHHPPKHSPREGEQGAGPAKVPQKAQEAGVAHYQQKQSHSGPIGAPPKQSHQKVAQQAGGLHHPQTHTQQKVPPETGPKCTPAEQPAYMPAVDVASLSASLATPPVREPEKTASCSGARKT